MVPDRDSASDAVQEAFFSAYRNMAGFRGGSVKSWLSRIAINAAMDAQRLKKRRPGRPVSGARGRYLAAARRRVGGSGDDRADRRTPPRAEPGDGADHERPAHGDRAVRRRGLRLRRDRRDDRRVRRARSSRASTGAGSRCAACCSIGWTCSVADDETRHRRGRRSPSWRATPCTTRSSSPRLAAGGLDDDAELARARSFVERCTACRALHDDVAAIGSALKLEAAAARCAAPRDFRLTVEDARRLGGTVRVGGFVRRVPALRSRASGDRSARRWRPSASSACSSAPCRSAGVPGGRPVGGGARSASRRPRAPPRSTRAERAAPMGPRPLTATTAIVPGNRRPSARRRGTRRRTTARRTTVNPAVVAARRVRAAARRSASGSCVLAIRRNP